MAFDAGSVYATLGGRFSSTGFHQFSSAMYKARSEMEATEKRQAEMAARSEASMQKIGHGAKVVAGGAIVGLTVVTGLAVKTAYDFEKSMRNVNSIAGLNEKQFRALSKAVLDMAGKTGQAPKTLADGMYQLVSSGFSARDSLKILRSSAIAATAGLTTTEVATTAVAAALNAYHLPASKAQQVSDILFQTVNRGVITFEELSHTIGTVLPFANSLHIPLAQVGAAISTLTKEGIPAANATTYLKNAMVQFLKPSKEMKAAIKATGAESGEALVKHKGFQGALEAVAATTDGTKAALQKLFPDIRASAAAFALTGTNAKTANADVKAFRDTTGATNKVFQEQSKSSAVQWQKFMATVKADAVVVGNAVLPLLNKGLRSVGQWLSGVDAGKVGHDLAAGFSEAGLVIGDVFGVLRDVAGALLDVGQALDLGDPTKIEAIIAAIAGFKIAGIVTPMVLNLASGLSNLILNARSAPTLAAFFADLPIGPVGLIAGAVAGLAGAIVLLGGSESTEEQIARNNADAHRDAAAAIRDQTRAEQDAANKGLAAQRATLNVQGAKQRVTDARQHVAIAEALPDKGDGSRIHAIAAAHNELKDAILGEKQASLDAIGAHDAYQKSIAHEDTVNTKNIQKAFDHLQDARKILDHVQHPGVQTMGTKGGGFSVAVPVDEKRQADALKLVADRTRDYIKETARANVSDANRNRLMNASKAITDKNAEGVSKLIQSMQGLPKRVQTKLLLDNQNALAKLGDVSLELSKAGKHHTVVKVLADASSATSALLALKAIQKGVPEKKVLHILTTAKTSKDEVSGLSDAMKKVKAPPTLNVRTTAPQAKSEVDALATSWAGFALRPNITKTITTIHRDVTSKGPGKAAGGKTSGPQMYLVGEGSDPVEWIIPRDPKHRGRAVELLMDAARSILPGAATGHKHGPGMISPPIGEAKFLKLSPDQFSAARDAAKTRRDNLEQAAKERDAKKHLTKKALKAREDLPLARTSFARADKIWKKAVGYSNLIQARLDNAQIAATNMGRFDTISQQVGKSGKPTAAAKKAEKDYLAAAAERLKYLKNAEVALRDAVQYGEPGSKWQRETRQNLAQVLADIEELHGAKSSGQKDREDTAAGKAKDARDQTKQDKQDEADTGMTKDEREKLAALQAQLAVAELTDTVQGPGEDIDIQTQIDTFLEQVLGEIQPGGARFGHASSTGLAAVAGQVKQARDDLKTLSAPPDVTADQQAILDQVTRQRDVAREESRLNAAAVAALQPDFGPGGQRGGDTYVFPSAFPPDPEQMRQAAGWVGEGFDKQGSPRSPRVPSPF